MGSRGRGPLTLAQLQNLIKRDQDLYIEEFKQQLSHFDANVQIFNLTPHVHSQDLCDLAMFMSHVAVLYPKEAGHVPEMIAGLVEQHGTVMDPSTRLVLCQACILLCSKGALERTRLYSLFFQLVSLPDKSLRTTLYNHMVADLAAINSKTKSAALNKALQNNMYKPVAGDDATLAHFCVKVIAQLYRKGAWRDSRSVNVIAEATHSPHTKVLVAALEFFLDSSNTAASNSDSDDDEDKLSISDVKAAMGIAGKTRKRERQLDRARKTWKKIDRKRKIETPQGFSALHLINDPQGLAERLFARLKQSSERFEVRLLMMDLISRLIGAHELILLNYYPFLQKYLQPKQREVTKILAYVTQACHKLVPPEAIEPIIRTLCHNFITERCSGGAMTIGLNTVRMICARCPSAMTKDVLNDLAQFKTYKRDKGVATAAWALVQLYRVLDPSMLARKDRGKDGGNTSAISTQYGSQHVAEHVPGIEHLIDNPNLSMGNEDGDWASASDDNDSGDDSDGSWLPIESDGDAVPDEPEEEPSENTADVAERAKAVSMQRILTPNDYAAIKKATLEEAVGKGKRKRQSRATGELNSINETVQPEDVTRLVKKQKTTKAEKQAALNSAKEGREKFVSKQQRMNSRTGGLSNKAKKRSKNLMMMMHGKSREMSRPKKRIGKHRNQQKGKR